MRVMLDMFQLIREKMAEVMCFDIFIKAKWNITRNHPHHPQIDFLWGATMAIEKWLDRLLDDWGWWVRERSGGVCRCRSIEGRYLPPRVAGDEKRVASRLVDVASCIHVERVVCSPGFPVVARGMLKGWYVLRTSREKITGKLGIPRAAFELELERAARMLKNNLDNRLQVSSIIAATNPTDRDKYLADGEVRTPRETQARLA
jgi:hypothetical protein